MCAFACFVSDGQGHSYDLSPLALDSRNWEVEPSAVTIGKRFYINVCRSLVQMGGQCPSVPVSSPLAAAAPVSSDSHSRRPNCFHRFLEVSFECGVLPAGRRRVCQPGSGGVGAHVGQKRPEAAVQQRPGLPGRETQQDQRHSLQV